MVHYTISTPRKQGDIWVADVSELIGCRVLRRTTIRINDISKFVKNVFHTLPSKYVEIIGITGEKNE